MGNTSYYPGTKYSRVPGVRPKGTRWMVDVTVRGTRKTSVVDTYEEALAAKASLKADLKAGRVALPKGRTWTLHEAYMTSCTHRWLKEVSKHRAPPTTTAQLLLAQLPLAQAQCLVEMEQRQAKLEAMVEGVAGTKEPGIATA